jgi:hypothetical protein
MKPALCGHLQNRIWLFFVSYVLLKIPNNPIL